MRLREIAELYKTTPAWLRLTPSSRRIYYDGFRHIEAEFMDMNVDRITRPMVLDFRDKNYDRKAKCRIGISTLAMLLQYAYDHGYVSDNPAKGVRDLPKKEGYDRWSQRDIDKVMAIAPQPVKDIIYVAVYTGQRRSDIIRMRWDNFDGQYIHIIQKKTRKPLAIPVHPLLMKELVRMKGDGQGTILKTATGQQWSDDYATKVVRDAAEKVGVKKSLHGLRKTTASVLSELGCTHHEIAAVTGQSLQHVIAYTKGADQKHLAMKAIERWTSSSTS